MSWSREFDPPLPGFRTLRDAANHITKLPKTEQLKPHWQTAGELLINAAEKEEAWVLMARIAMLKALLPDTSEPPPRERRRAKKYRVLR